MKLTILDPGHFHAALVQKSMYAGVDDAVDVYAPAGPDLDDYLRKIDAYNARAQDPDALARAACTPGPTSSNASRPTGAAASSSSPAATRARRST